MRPQTDQRAFIHRIDAEDRICFVNDAWLAFADENDWSTSAEQALGTPLLSHLSDPETRHIYRLLIERARNGAPPAGFRYRCDSPELMRSMEMRISQGRNGQIEFRSRVLRLERREPILLLDSGLRQRSSAVLEMCSWCKAVRAETAWLGLEEAVQRLGMLAQSGLPQLSHGICPACSASMTQVGDAQ
jgi:hypothetical protein